MIKFSLIMSVYAKETPCFFLQCLNSIITQTVVPDELIIVKDGSLPDELESILQNLVFPNEVKIIALPMNVTQGPARGEALAVAQHEWVAIMDSDDICCSDRFEKQIKTIEDNPELSLIGGQIAEFSGEKENIVAFRTVPIYHEAICRFAKKRNPFNSMTVMLKRELALQAGNYDYFPGFEDYDLWVRMIKKGAVCFNHSDVLVYARVGSGMYERRRGMAYIKSELRMQKQLLNIGFINKYELIRNIIVRVPVRLLPGKNLAALYNKFTRDRNSK